MLARRLCVCNAGLKVDARREISTVVMTSYYKNVCSCKRHTVVRCAFCFGDSFCSFLASRLTTVSHYRESWYILPPRRDIYCIYYLCFLLMHSWALDSSAIWHLYTFSSLWSEMWKWYIHSYHDSWNIVHIFTIGKEYYKCQSSECYLSKNVFHWADSGTMFVLCDCGLEVSK